jgi:hypothetical protein
MSDVERGEGFTPITIDSKTAQEGLLHALYFYLHSTTKDEVEGTFKNEKIIGENKELRKLFIELVDSLGFENKFFSVDWLFLGISEKVPDEDLNRWAAFSQGVMGTLARHFQQSRTNK